jgi:UDP-glucose 4-epimerase
LIIGKGYLGHHLIEKIKEKKMIILDRNVKEKKELRVEYIRGDFKDYKLLENIFSNNNIETVVV